MTIEGIILSIASGDSSLKIPVNIFSRVSIKPM